MNIKDLKKKIPKKNKGVSEVFISTLIAVFFLMSVFFVCIVGLKPFFINPTLQNISREAGLRMEADGGLSNTTRNYIISSLNSLPGFKENNLEIDASNTDTNPANYGDPISIDLKYTYQPTKFDFVGLSVKASKGTPQIVSAHFSTTSKKIIVVDH